MPTSPTQCICSTTRADGDRVCVCVCVCGWVVVSCLHVMVTRDMYWRSLREAWLCVCSTSVQACSYYCRFVFFCGFSRTVRQSDDRRSRLGTYSTRHPQQRQTWRPQPYREEGKRSNMRGRGPKKKEGKRKERKRKRKNVRATNSACTVTVTATVSRISDLSTCNTYMLTCLLAYLRAYLCTGMYANSYVSGHLALETFA